MLRLVSLFGVACLAVAAVALSSPSRSSSVESLLPLDEGLAETPNRLPASVAAVLPTCPSFHARFSLN